MVWCLFIITETKNVASEPVKKSIFPISNSIAGGKKCHNGMSTQDYFLWILDIKCIETCALLDAKP